MAESPRRVDLRLTIPVTAPFRELAVELAVKFAEYAGMSAARAGDVHAAVEAALTQVRGPSIEIVLASQNGELVLTTSPSTRRATFPLTDD